MTELHGLAAPLLVGILAVMGAAAAALSVAGRAPGALDVARRVVLVVLVAQAAIGLALAVRGNAPSEGIHWLYGGAVLVVLLLAGSLEGTPARRSAALAVGSVLAAALTWRLWTSG